MTKFLGNKLKLTKAKQVIALFMISNFPTINILENTNNTISVFICALYQK